MSYIRFHRHLRSSRNIFTPSIDVPPTGLPNHPTLWERADSFCLKSQILSKLRFALLPMALLCLLPAALMAQGASATISGFVTDPSGAKIPVATVDFSNTATGVSGATTTNAAGLYRLSGLLPGPYRFTVSMQGFKTLVRGGIDLHIEDQVSLDFTLEVGASSESVTVQAGASMLETQTPTISQVIEGRQVQDTPLNGRNSMNLVALTPGVVAQGASQGSPSSNNVSGGAFSNAVGFGNYSIAGGLSGVGSVYVDGAPINLLIGHEVAYIVTQDAVQEFRVESSVVNPQYGAFGGGVVSFATKSGTSRLHGTVYEYLRNNIFNANSFFNNQTIVNGASVPRPEFTQNQFGATAGGPIPHAKAFFFVSYEGYRLAQGVPNLGRVPTPAELSGDFRADGPVYDPASSKTVNGVTTEQQISCNGVLNMICPNSATAGSGSGSFIDPTSNVMGNVLHYFPTPNTSAGPAINFSQNGKAGATSEQYDVRVDQNLGSKQKIFARYSRLDRSQPGTQFLFNPLGPSAASAQGSSVQQYIAGDTVLLNSSSVIDIRASYLRFFAYDQPVASAVNLAQFDGNAYGGTGHFWSTVGPHLGAQTFPDVSITGNIPQPFNLLNFVVNQPLNNYVLSATLSKVIGRHSLSFGGEARQQESYFGAYPQPTGSFSFAGTATSCVPSAVKVCAGSAPVAPGAGATPIADFVIGTITAAPAGFESLKVPSVINHLGGVFANDIFQITQRLTVTAGLRYELPGGFLEKHDSNAVLLPQLANPLVLVNTPTYPSRSDLKGHHTLFSPRIGASFSPQAETTVRAGYSYAFYPSDTVVIANPEGSTINQATTFISPGTKLSNPLAKSVAGPTTILLPLGRQYANNPTYYYGQTIQGRDPNRSFPSLQQWNASVQQSLTPSTVVQLAYLGARGDHIPVNQTLNLNQIPDQYDSAPSQSLRPYPQYQNVSETSPYLGNTYYDSLQATFTKRFSAGGTILANYSWSKFLSNAESSTAAVESHPLGVVQDNTNLRAEKSYLSFDVPHRLVVSYILDLPVGKGKRYLSNKGALTENLISGWNATGINSFQSGFPVAITATANVLATTYGAGTIRPNVVPGCRKVFGGSITARVRSGQPVLNAACFTPPATFGDEPRTDGQARTQGLDNWDFSIGKTTAITESVNLVFRAEAFNLLNNVQFGDPNLSSASALFGVITTQVNSPRLLQFSLRLNY